VKVKSKREKADIGSYRIHESKGEIHVHDDANKLKASVPVFAWWKMWDKLRNEPGTWTWVDPHFKTKLVVQTVLDESGIDVTLNVSSVAFGDAWEKINTFSKKK